MSAKKAGAVPTGMCTWPSQLQCTATMLSSSSTIWPLSSYLVPSPASPGGGGDASLSVTKKPAAVDGGADAGRGAAALGGGEEEVEDTRTEAELRKALSLPLLDAFSVHGACGMWGMIAAALFATPSLSHGPITFSRFSLAGSLFARAPAPRSP